MKKNKFLFFCFFVLLSIKKIISGNSTCFEYSCDECDSPEYGNCTKCRKGFKLIDGTCPCSDSSCALCSTGLAGLHICFLCKNGYFNFENDCFCDINECEQCSEDTCILCKSGYFFNSTSNNCEKQNETEKINCYDENCDSCFSEQKGACDYCKEGYNFEKGECFELPKPDNNNNCPDGYYLKDNFCEKKCGGVACPNREFYYYLCPINKCLVCSNNELQIFSECDNSENCTINGCLNCITNDECLICNQGYYLLSGICLKCIEGCSLCSNNDTCIYCLSGYELNSEKKCDLVKKFDFNVNKYKKIKNRLIEIYYPKEIISSDSDIVSPVLECDSNCAKCYENIGKCKECNTLYYLENNTCIKHCSDENCLDCSLHYGNEKCYVCKEGYIEKGDKCIYNCTDENCASCTFENNIEKCEKCKVNYELDKSGINCKPQFNYVSLIFGIIGILIIIISILSFCLYKKNRNESRREIYNFRIAALNNNANTVNVYGRNQGIDNSGRIELNKEELGEEFEKQKRKMEKGNQTCQYCKKSPGKFKCDCGCIVCSKHSVLKEIVKKGQKYKVCFACKKKVKNVNQIKYDCNICLQKKISVAQFKCNCALQVCKDCYIKCKMANDKCPQCRAPI